MRSIGVRELRQNASALLRDVEHGVSFQITDRGRPVGILAPLADASPLEQLRAAGEIDPSRGSVRDLPPPLKKERGRPLPSAELARLRSRER